MEDVYFDIKIRNCIDEIFEPVYYSMQSTITWGLVWNYFFDKVGWQNEEIKNAIRLAIMEVDD